MLYLEGFAVWLLLGFVLAICLFPPEDEIE